MVSLQVEMGVVFLTKRNFWEWTIFFLEKSVVQKQNELWKRIEKLSFFYGTINFNERTLLLNEQTEKMENGR